jgi:hypothetical protein
LKGANFSRAMRSQVSSTWAKVSAEWSAKRARCSSVCTRSQSCSRKSSVSRIVAIVLRSSGAVASRAASTTAIVAEAFITSVRGHRPRPTPRLR